MPTFGPGGPGIDAPGIPKGPITPGSPSKKKNTHYISSKRKLYVGITLGKT